MVSYFKLFILQIISLVLSGSGSYLFMHIMSKHVGTGTGAAGEGLLVLLATVSCFLLLIIITGSVLYWLMFT